MKIKSIIQDVTGNDAFLDLLDRELSRRMDVSPLPARLLKDVERGPIDRSRLAFEAGARGASGPPIWFDRFESEADSLLEYFASGRDGAKAKSDCETDC